MRDPLVTESTLSLVLQPRGGLGDPLVGKRQALKRHISERRGWKELFWSTEAALVRVYNLVVGALGFRSV